MVKRQRNEQNGANYRWHERANSDPRARIRETPEQQPTRRHSNDLLIGTGAKAQRQP